MSDLISRSELIKFFEKHIRTAKDFREIIINIIPTIENQPTAYDVDKVVEELNNVSFLSETRHCKNGFPIDNVVLLDKAIEIVKTGIKDEN